MWLLFRWVFFFLSIFIGNFLYLAIILISHEVLHIHLNLLFILLDLTIICKWFVENMLIFPDTETVISPLFTYVY